MKDYSRLLRSVDSWFRSVRKKFPAEVACAKGCHDCCIGVFDISLADRDLLREGLARLDPKTRRGIQTRADDVMARLRSARPALGGSLEGLREEEIDRLCDLFGSVECPALGAKGACRLYEYRPLTCRLAGVPVVDLSGETVSGEGCARCSLRVDAVPRLDCHELHRRELAVLRRIDPDRHGVTLLIPQALESRSFQ